MKRIRPMLLGGILAVASLAPYGIGCGARSSNTPRVTSPFGAEHARAFDGRVDFINDPDILERNWRDDWNDELQKRVSGANVIAVVRIDAMRATTDPEQRTIYHLTAIPETRIFGGVIPEFDLGVREGDLGFASVHRNQQQILQHMFVMFVKWAEDEGGQVVARWHLSPATDAVLRRTRFLVQQRRDAPTKNAPGTRRVIDVDAGS